MQSRRLFEALSASHPLKLSESEFEQEFSDLLPALNQQGFLQKSEPSLEVICPALPNNCLVTAQRSNECYYVHCECSDEVGLVEIDPKYLRQFRFDLPVFLHWLISAAIIEADLKEEEPGELWYLGEKTLSRQTAEVYFSRLQDAEQIQRLQKELHKQGNPPIIFWLGETPRRRQFPPGIIALPEIIAFSEKGASLEKGRIEACFTKRLIIAGSGDIILDDEIALRKKRGKCFLLFGQERKNQFVEEVSILPQAFEIIRHLYQIRKYRNNAESLAEIRDRGFASQRSTVSNRISGINRICEQHNVTLIFKKFPGNKWGLNPVLSCCNTSRRSQKR